MNTSVRLLFFIMLLSCLPSWANTIILRKPEDVVKEAPLIVDAIVTDVAFTQMPISSGGFATVTLSVTQILAGTATNTVILRRYGIAADGRYLFSSYTPEYHVGERVILSMIWNENGYYQPLGLYNGYYRIVDGHIAGTTVTADQLKEEIDEVLSGVRVSFSGGVPRFETKDLEGNSAGSAGKTMSDDIDPGPHLGGQFVTLNESWEDRDIDLWYHESPQVTTSNVVARLYEAIGAWEEASLYSIDFHYRGTTPSGFAFDSQSVILWEEGNPGDAAREWEYPYPGGRGPETKKGSDIVFNIFHHWYFEQTPLSTPRTASYLDFGDILVHELGHTLGLFHTSDDSTRMVDGYEACDVDPLRTLAGGDKAGAIYQHPNETISGTFQYDLELPKSLWSGISEYETSGNMIIYGSLLRLAGGTKLKVSNGTTLSLSHDAVLESGASTGQINVYGTLNADEVTFEPRGSSWGGMHFQSGSSGTISYADISGAGITVSNADVAIDHSTLTGTGSGTGIYATGSTADVDISWSNISDYGGGVNFTSTAFGHLWRSAIDVSATAFSTSFYADPYIGAYPYNNGGNNELLGDWVTVGGYYGSTIWGGSSGYNGNNYVCDGATFYDAVEDGSSTVTMVGSYWPANPPDHNAGGVDAGNPLGTSSSNCPPSAGKGFTSLADPQTVTVDRGLLEARDLMSEAAYADAGPDDPRFQRAAALLKEVRAEHAGTPDAVAALVALFRLARLQGTEEQRPYFEGLATETGPDQADALGILIQAYRQWGDTGRARETASALSERFADQWHAFYAQLSLFEMDLEAGDYAGAATTLGGMEARDEFEAARLLAAWNELERLSGEAHSYDVSPRASDGASEDTDQTVQPLTLVEAYPNPFNPEVVIAFELSRETDVRITMFDAVGRVVGRLADRPFGAGRHRVDWNAAGMASGSYFAVVRAGGAARTLPILHQK